jgi:putative acetyltransferase
MRSLAVHRESFESRAAYELILALNAELAHRYPEPDANHFRLTKDEVAPGRGAFLIARSEGEPIGCGALRKIDTDTAEIKRMYVAPNHRGLGVGRELVKKLETVALDLGVYRLVLETGARQPESLALFRRCGFVEIPKFGEYVDSPLSVCMEKTLTSR